MRKRSPIWKISISELKKIVKSSSTISAILAHFNLENKGSNYRTLQKRLQEDNIDYSHIKLGLNSNKNKKIPKVKIPLSEILTENSHYSRRSLKKRLLQDGLLVNQCYICGQLPEWNGKPLILQLDHINGISNDNRLENLRILCPHCHSQTETFAGKRFKKITPSEINPNWRQNPRINNRKVERPTKEELEKLLWKLPITKIAKQFSVSDKAVAKWAKSYELIKPPRGYWLGK